MKPADDPTSIGCILVSTGVITEQQLQNAITERQQVSPDELLGLFMVGREVIDHEQLKRVLKLQKQLRDEHNKTVRTLAQAEVASASITRAQATANRVRAQLLHRRGNNGANVAGK